MNKLASIYVSRLLLMAAVGGTTVALFSPSGLNVGYGASQRCLTLVEPEREQWTEYCRKKNSEQVGDLVLQEIYQHRVTKLLENSCNPSLEQWHCERDHQLAGEYREIFFNRFGKSEQK